MKRFAIIDTVPAFLDLWKAIKNLPVEEQIRMWDELYGRLWPELLWLQRSNYRVAGVAWHNVASARIFPRLPRQIAGIRVAHRHLLTAIPELDPRVRKVIGLRAPVTYVLYVGIGCGAGWATEYDGKPAVLFGLENIVDTGWTGIRRVRAIVAHELSHVMHSQLRHSSGDGGLDVLRGPYGLLYEEGFATRMELEVLGPEAPRAMERDRGWSKWCGRHRESLAGAFLKNLSTHASIGPFFGSWYSIDGHIETGYWLGMEVIKQLERSMTLKEIAKLPNAEIRPAIHGALKAIAGSSP